MKPTVNRFSTPSVKMSDSESKIIIMTESRAETRLSLRVNSSLSLAWSL